MNGRQQNSSNDAQFRIRCQLANSRMLRDENHGAGDVSHNCAGRSRPVLCPPQGLLFNLCRGTEGAHSGARVRNAYFCSFNVPLSGAVARRRPLQRLVMWQHLFYDVYVHWLCYTRATVMRTNIVIDDKLIAEAIKVTGASTKKEAVELGLKALIQLKRQEQIRGLRGKLKWKDDLDRMRLDA
jgi:Arc/MetJ family transcription regulator